MLQLITNGTRPFATDKKGPHCQCSVQYSTLDASTRLRLPACSVGCGAPRCLPCLPPLRLPPQQTQRQVTQRWAEQPMESPQLHCLLIAVTVRAGSVPYSSNPPLPRLSLRILGETGHSTISWWTGSLWYKHAPAQDPLGKIWPQAQGNVQASGSEHSGSRDPRSCPALGSSGVGWWGAAARCCAGAVGAPSSSPPSRDLFGYKKFWNFNTVVFLFLFDKHCLVIE